MNPASMQADNPYATFGTAVVHAPADARVAFIRKTYLHLAAAIYGFVALEFLIFKAFNVNALMAKFIGIPYAMLIMLVAFIGVSVLANRWARSDTSVVLQYAGLGLYTLFEAIIFVPLLWYAQDRTVNLQFLGNVQVLTASAVTTLGLFGALTAVVFLTRKDFSFLGAALRMAGLAAIVLILASIFMGFSLGLFFIGAMILFACGWVLYDTSNVLRHYNTHQHVAAALALFSSITLLLWYVIQLFMAFSSRD